MANSPYEKELEKRRKIIKKKITTFGTLIILAILSFFAAGFVPPALVEAGVAEPVANVIHLVLRGIHVFGSLVGVLGFATSLHDPLTPEEAKELKEKEIAEKSGYNK